MTSGTGGASWSELRALLERALEASEPERARLLGELRDADPERASALEDLLRADAVAGSPLDGDAAGLLDESVLAGPAAAAERVGRRLGAWQLGERIGQGGMGAVYAARRIDGAFEQSAAVKVLRAGFDTPELRARFLLERQLLATFDHPSIVRVLDGGVAADGLLWFALERVAGRPITDWARERGLDVAARLRLFLAVCDAVEAAHRRLIVHRDLKPSNVLVTDEGVPKLLDFGIAKVLEGDDPALTRTDARPMTPQYAAPEQILGEPPTTGVDVYALGVLLYELLTDDLPHQRAASSPAALVRELTRETLTSPSRRVAARGPQGRSLARRLAGDLDAILLKALRPEPEQRYRSVAELADDLNAHLAGRPVAARGGARGYRIRSFARRHRLGVAAASFAAASLLIGAGAALWQAAAALRAEAAAREEAETARRVSEFLVELFKINEPGEARGNTVTARELLDRGAARVEEQLGGQPAVRARLQRAIGRAYGELGLYELQVAAYERALSAQTVAHGDESPQVAAALTDLAQAQIGQGEYRQALERAKRAVALLERVADREGVALADALSQLGIAHWYLGELDAARASLERSLTLRQAIVGSESPDLGGILNNVAILRAQAGDVAGASALYERALGLFERALGPEHPNVARTLNNLAILATESGDPERARGLHARSLAIRRRILASDHPEIAESLNNLGETRRALGDLAGARAAFEESLAIRERALGADHALVGATLLNLGLTQVELGDEVAARALLERSVDVLARALGENHYHLGFPLKTLGKMDRAKGDLARSERELGRALALLESGLPWEDPEVVDARAAYAQVLRDLGRDAEAEAVLRSPTPRAPAR